MQIARIRLSPASSGLRARQVGTAPRQGIEAERLVEILVRILAIPGARLSAASDQPALKTSLHIPAYHRVDRQNRSLGALSAAAPITRHELALAEANASVRIHPMAAPRCRHGGLLSEAPS